MRFAQLERGERDDNDGDEHEQQLRASHSLDAARASVVPAKRRLALASSQRPGYLRIEINEFGAQAQLIVPGRRPKSGMTAQAFCLLFVAVLANQAGVPLPVVPALVAAGVLSAHAGAGMVPSILVTVVAALVADAIWYGLGRWRGREALRAVARLLRRSAEYVDSAEGHFRDHQLAFLFGGRFLPELNPITAGMAGAARLRPRRYSAIAIASALAWAGGWTGAGYALGNVAREAPVPLLSLAAPVVVIGAILAVGLALKHRRRLRHDHHLPGGDDARRLGHPAASFRS